MIRETERMSAVDAAWLRMDRPTNLMMIVGVIVFDSRVDFRRFRRTIKERFLAFRRFRCCARPAAVSADWETDADFDLDRHVLCARLAAARGPGRARGIRLGARECRLRSRPPDVAVPFHRALPGRQCRDPAHPPLLRRRHGDGARLPDAHRRRGESRCDEGGDARGQCTAPGRRRGRGLAWPPQHSWRRAPAAGVRGRGRLPGARGGFHEESRAGSGARAPCARHRGRARARRDALGRSAHAVQGAARHAQDRGLDRSAAARRSEDRRPRARLHASTTS